MVHVTSPPVAAIELHAAEWQIAGSGAGAAEKIQRTEGAEVRGARCKQKREREMTEARLLSVVEGSGTRRRIIQRHAGMQACLTLTAELTTPHRAIAGSPYCHEPMTRLIPPLRRTKWRPHFGGK